MKTQINTLVNGRIDGKIGSKESERCVISQKVIEENGENLKVKIKGIEFNLQIVKSTTGKTIDYYTKISEEQAKLLLGVPEDYRMFKYESSYNLHVDMTMRVSVDKFTRKSEASQWKFRGYDYIEEYEVDII